MCSGTHFGKCGSKNLEGGNTTVAEQSVKASWVWNLIGHWQSGESSSKEQSEHARWWNNIGPELLEEKWKYINHFKTEGINITIRLVFLKILFFFSLYKEYVEIWKM